MSRALPNAAFALLLASAALMGGCDSGYGITADYASIQSDMFEVGCINGACHNSENAAGDLVLEADVSFANLIDVPSTRSNDSRSLVIPGNSTDSFLFNKLNGDLAAGEGAVMPTGGRPALSADDLAALAAWIDAGAPQ